MQSSHWLSCVNSVFWLAPLKPSQPIQSWLSVPVFDNIHMTSFYQHQHVILRTSLPLLVPETPRIPRGKYHTRAHTPYVATLHAAEPVHAEEEGMMVMVMVMKVWSFLLRMVLCALHVGIDMSAVGMSGGGGGGGGGDVRGGVMALRMVVSEGEWWCWGWWCQKGSDGVEDGDVVVWSFLVHMVLCALHIGIDMSAIGLYCVCSWA